MASESSIRFQFIATTLAILLSVLFFGLAIYSQSLEDSLIGPEKHVDLVFFISFAILLPIWLNQVLHESFVKPKLNAIETHALNIIQSQESESIKCLGVANDVAPKIFDQLLCASEVYNTFVAFEAPYTNSTNDHIVKVISRYIKEDRGMWEETVSEFGFSRVKQIEDMIGQLPQTFKVRRIRKDKGVFPVCNFVILKYPHTSGRASEIYLGWGYFHGGANDNVFWSNQKELVSFFLAYHRALRTNEISVPYPTPDPEPSSDAAGENINT